MGDSANQSCAFPGQEKDTIIRYNYKIQFTALLQRGELICRFKMYHAIIWPPKQSNIAKFLCRSANKYSDTLVYFCTHVYFKVTYNFLKCTHPLLACPCICLFSFFVFCFVLSPPCKSASPNDLLYCRLTSRLYISVSSWMGPCPHTYRSLHWLQLPLLFMLRPTNSLHYF